jgi:hypothetical protein
MRARGLVAILSLAWLTGAAADPSLSQTTPAGVVWLPVAVPAWPYPGHYIVPQPFLIWPQEGAPAPEVTAQPAPEPTPPESAPPQVGPVTEQALAPLPTPAAGLKPAAKPAKRPTSAKPTAPKPRKLCWKDNVLAPCP